MAIIGKYSHENRDKDKALPVQNRTAQQARNFSMHMEEQNLACTILQRDQDTKYIVTFDQVFVSAGTKIKKTPARSPNLQAYVERVIQTLKHEVLNGFCIVSDSHLNHILRTAQDWCNHRRGHSACSHLPPVRESDTPATVNLGKDKLTCVEELGGHLKSYRAAA